MNETSISAIRATKFNKAISIIIFVCYTCSKIHFGYDYCWFNCLSQLCTTYHTQIRTHTQRDRGYITFIIFHCSVCKLSTRNNGSFDIDKGPWQHFHVGFLIQCGPLLLVRSALQNGAIEAATGPVNRITYYFSWWVNKIINSFVLRPHAYRHFISSQPKYSSFAVIFSIASLATTFVGCTLFIN